MSYIGYYEDCCNGENPPVIPTTNKYNIVERNVDFEAIKFTFYSISTLANIVNVTLPTNPENGDWVGFIDRLGTFSTRNLVIKDNGFSTIKNENNDLIIDINDVNFKLVYNNGNWFIFDMSVSSNGAPGSPIYNITNITNNFTAEPQRYYTINTINNIITVNLPNNPVDGYWIGFIDIGGNLTVNNFIIIYNNIPIASNPGNFIVNVNFVNFKLVYNNNNWILIDSSIVIDGRDGVDGTNGLQGIQGVQGPAGSGTTGSGYELFDLVPKTTNFVAEPFKYYTVSTASNIVNVTLPSNPTPGQWIGIIDNNGTFGGNSLFIKYTGIPIRSNAGDLEVDVSYINFKLVYENNNWILLDYSAAVAAGETGSGSGTGLQGIQGIQGVTGIGIQGVQGPSGTGTGTGTQGIQGIQGVIGIQGPAGTGTGTGTSYELFDIVNVSSNFVAEPFKYYSVSTVSNIVNVTLPTNPVSGQWVGFIDPTGNFAINNLIINYTGIPIRSNAGNLQIDVAYINFKLVYNNNNWILLDYSAAVVTSGEPSGGPLTYSVYDASGVVNTIVNSYYLINTSPSIATINLPASPVNGDWIIISDKFGTFGNNKAVLKYANGKTIANNADDVELDFNNAKLKLVYFNNNWDILNHS